MGPKSPDGSPPTLADAPSASNRTQKISQRYSNRKFNEYSSYGDIPYGDIFILI